MYTSYFGNLKNVPLDYTPIAICAKVPKGYKGLQYKKIAPSYNILMRYKADGDEEAYIRDYKEEILRELNPKQIYRELKNYARTDKIVLLCYEKPEDFCHRHIVAEWFTNAGIETSEL